MKPLREFVLDVLASFRKRDQRRLRKLNDEVSADVALHFSSAEFNLAIYSYALSKVVSKPRFLSSDYAVNLKAMEKALERIANVVDSDAENRISAAFSDLEHAIASLEQRDPRFIVDLVTKGKLKMAATLYAQGLSLGVASEMTGMEKQEILDYAGETMMFDRLKDEKRPIDRLKIARALVEA